MAVSAQITPRVREITLADQADFAGWREAARRLLAADVPPTLVAWRVDPDQRNLFEWSAPAPAAMSCSVPRKLLRLLGEVALHADPDRFALMYRLLWRVTHGERDLLLRAADRDLTRAEAMAADVRRAAQKLRHLARFHEIERPDGAHLVAWFEPEHHVLELVASWFNDRFARRRWSIVTPSRSVQSEGGVLRFGPGGQRRDVPHPGAAQLAWQAWAQAVLEGPSPGTVVPLRKHLRPACVPILVVEGLPADGRGDRAQRLLERAVAEAGLDGSALRWVRVRAGGRRRAVRRLDLERGRLQPGLVLALGSRAAEALLERPVTLALERGRMLPLADGSRLLIAGDPAAILALADGLAQGREYRRLVGDLMLAVPFQLRAA